MLDRRLQYFLAVAREGSFSRAADVLHVAQPAVSRQVALLEAELGVQLLERGPGGVKPTDAGRRLVERGGALERDATTLRDELLAYGDGRRGRVAMGYSTSLGYGTAPAIVAALRERLPDVEVRPELRPTPDLAGAVQRGALDLALARSVPDAGDALERVVVRREPLGVLLDAGHPLAAAAAPGQPVPLGALAGVPISLHDRAANPGHHDFVVAACRAAGFEPRLVAPATPFDPAYGALLGAGAVSLVGESAQDGTPAPLVWRRLRDAPPVEISLLVRRGEASPVVLRVAAAVRAAAVASGWVSA